MRLGLILLVVLVVVPGCMTPNDAAVKTAGRSSGATSAGGGPFAIGATTHEQVKSFDGTLLDGWVILPKVPDGARVPVVFVSTPYVGQQTISPEDPAYPDQAFEGPVRAFVEAGYAFATFNVRGSGNSGGCADWLGPNEQKDQLVLIDWLANRSWSNGRVAMYGFSYDGTTPWEAAVERPEHLAAIVVAGVIPDLYLQLHTPQGAQVVGAPLIPGQFLAVASLAPPYGAGRTDHMTTKHASVLADRACPDVARMVARYAAGAVMDDRDAAFFASRRLTDRIPNATAAVLLAHGFQDPLMFEEDPLWGLIHAPKRQIEGQWGHEFPDTNSVHPEWSMKDWGARVVKWLDPLMKGDGAKGDGPDVGTVDYQDGAGAWRNSTAWPPAEAGEEALHLAGDALVRDAGSPTARSFRAAPTPGGGSLGRQILPIRTRAGIPYDQAIALCPPVPGVSLAFATTPLDRNATIAGNPFAVLDLTSDQPGGVVSVNLFDVAPDLACGPDGSVKGARLLAWGAADLRFNDGNYVARDFPVGKATQVRIDINNLAEVLPAGHRLVALVSHGDTLDRQGRYAPAITVGPQSVLVVPLVDGTLGGARPVGPFPARPFVLAPSAH